MQEYKILSDRQKIKEVLQNCIYPLATDTQPPWLPNVVTGPHATVNADEYINIGREQMSELESGWPTSFNKTLTNNVAFNQEEPQAGRKASRLYIIRD